MAPFRSHGGPVVLGLALAALACGCAPPPAAPAARLVRLGWTGSPDTLHPGRALLAYAYTVLGLVYDTLFELGPDGGVRPLLARGARCSADGRTWTFDLRTERRFHDGTPVTARDVAFSYALYLTRQDYPLLHTYTESFRSVHAADDSTVILELDRPVADLESQLIFLYVLPQHLWEGFADDLAAAPPTVGSGPFRVVEFARKSHVYLAADASGPDAPAVAGVLFQTFANRDALVMALRTGQVDAILEMPFTALRDLRARPDIAVLTGTPLQPEVTDLILNQADPAHCPAAGACSGHPALRDVRVRRALARALDKEKLIETALLGAGRPGLTLLPEALRPWYDQTLDDVPFDPAAAARALDESGWVDGDGDGVREAADGTPLSLRLQWPSDSAIGARAADLVSAMWRRVGVGVRPRPADADALAADCCPAFDYDVILWGWTTGPDPSFLLGTMLSDRLATGGNETGFADAAFDSLYHLQAGQLDRERRRQLVSQMQRLVHEAVVYIVPFYPDALQAYRRDGFGGWPDAPRVALESRASLLGLRPLAQAAP